MPKVDQEEKVKELPIKGKTLAELAKELKVAKATKKKADEKSKQYGNLINRLATGPLAKLMEDADLDFTNVSGVGALEYSIELYPYVKADDVETFHKWLRDTKNGYLIKEAVHYKTLQAFVREQLEAAKTLPGYVNVAKIPTVSITKERKSKKLKK